MTNFYAIFMGFCIATLVMDGAIEPDDFVAGLIFAWFISWVFGGSTESKKKS